MFLNHFIYNLMMIFGIGTDIIEVERVEWKITKEDFLKKVFSPAEISYCEKYNNKAEHYAARFAAKEAFLKALGTGWQGKFSFSDIEVLPDELGKPVLNFLGNLESVIQELKISNHHVSLSHIKDMATAIVILEK